MRTILFIVQKEFLQIFRNKSMLPLIFAMPIIQLLILANAATYEIENINLHMVDNDLSSYSQQLAGKLEASPYFRLVNHSFSHDAAFQDLLTEKADLILTIPSGFEKDLLTTNKAQLHLSLNAINGSKAGVANSYIQTIIQDFNQHIRTNWLNQPKGTLPMHIDVTYANWYNPDMDYQTFMVPGIMVLLVTMIGMFLSGMNIVKEKEIGTIEQLNVTPIKKHHFIIGKLLPFWVIAIGELAFGLLVGIWAFNVPVVGSIGLIFIFAAVYLLVVLGIGLLVSTFTDTQQQAMFISWFFLVIFILMSGLFTAIENMPAWAQKITWFNPVAYFVEVIRMVMLKGSGFAEISWHFTVMIVFAVIINTLAVWNYRKTV